MVTSNSVMDWLLEGDPVIRWQALRDLCDQPADVWEAERQQTLETGWGAQFLQALGPDGEWPEGRWTGTVWTLLTIMDCGLPADHPALHSAAARFTEDNLTPKRAADRKWLLNRMDLCHLGFWLRIGAYFLGEDPRLSQLAGVILDVQMADGGWNCRIRTEPKTRHSSFHTTFNVLEGLRVATDAGIVARSDFEESEARAMEFMLMHQMYRSDRTGEIVDERFTHLTYPSHWHYNVLRGLDFMRHCRAIGDARLVDPLALLESRCKSDGRWPVEKRIPGTMLFDMERPGGESRWNTLRALRVLNRRHEAAVQAI